jgi:hypothetical protein
MRMRPSAHFRPAVLPIGDRDAYHLENLRHQPEVRLGSWCCARASP